MQQQLNNIYEVLAGGVPPGQPMGVATFLLLMATSLAAALAAAYLYVRFYGYRATGSQVHRAFPLLGISITAIFICIQFSLPLSLGLLGALSIVRFRTPIKEPEEIGFIMLVIAVSIATATIKLAFVAMILVVAVAALAAQALGRRLRRGRMGGTIVISVPGAGAGPDGAALADLLRKRLGQPRLESVARHDAHVVYAYQFQDASSADLLGLQADLTSAAATSTFNVFLNRPVAL